LSGVFTKLTIWLCDTMAKGVERGLGHPISGWSAAMFSPDSFAFLNLALAAPYRGAAIFCDWALSCPFSHRRWLA
jgi:hypothetical protein